MLKSLRNILLGCLLLFIVIWFVGSQPLFISPQKKLSAIVSVETLENNVIHLSERLPGRIGQERALEPTIEWIEKQLSPYGKPYRQSFQNKGENFHNVILEFGPEVPNPDSEIIVLGAHYDTAFGLPGADDNASGVAGLIEVARLLYELTSKGNELKHRVQLAFYTLEEPPYFRTNKMGSYIHSKQLRADAQKVKIMIAVDMIGFFTDEPKSQHLPFPLMDKIYSDKGNFISIIGNLSNMLTVREVKNSFKSATNLPVFSFNAPTVIQGIDFSDHLNFWYHDFPAVMVTDTSFNRYKYYHTAEDTAEKLDYEKMAEVVKALYQTAITLASKN